RTPRASASSIIPKAARSLTEPPGFMNSALPRISQPVSSDSRRKRKRGVRPMCPSTPAERTDLMLTKHQRPCFPGNHTRERPRPRARLAKLLYCLLSVGLRCVTEVGLYFPHPFGEQLGRIIIRDGRHHDAILAILPV